MSEISNMENSKELVETKTETEKQFDYNVTNSEDTVETVDDEQENEKEYNDVVNKINSYNLNWTHRSIEYIVNKRNITFNQLRSCQFKYGKNNDQVGYNVYKACSLIIQAGLVGSKQVKETDLALLEEKAADIIDEWREEVGYIGILHIILINIMEKKHFFMDTRGIKVLKYMSSKNLQEDLVNMEMVNDLQMKIQQSQAVSLQ